MTLEQWTLKYGIQPSFDNLVSQRGVPGDARWDLFHLSDYHVTSACCMHWRLTLGSSLEPHRASTYVSDEDLLKDLGVL